MEVDQNRYEILVWMQDWLIFIWKDFGEIEIGEVYYISGVGEKYGLMWNEILNSPSFHLKIWTY